MSQAFELVGVVAKSYEDPTTGDWVVEGPVTSENRDLQGQISLVDAVRRGLATWEELGGPVDYNHWSVQRPEDHPDYDPTRDDGSAPVRWIVGYGQQFDGPLASGGNGPWVRTTLLKGSKAAQDCWRFKQTGGKLYYSIGGKATVRGDTLINTNVTHVALTPYPANPDCEVGIVALAKAMGHDDSPSFLTPLLNRLDTLIKALTAGSGPAEGADGGRVLVGEDLEGQPRTRSKRDCPQHSNDCDTDDTSAGETMLKGINTDNLSELEKLEADPDPKTSLFAKALGGICGAIATLAKSMEGKGEEMKKDDEDGDPENDSKADADMGNATADDDMAKNLTGPLFNLQDPYGVAVDAETLAKGLLGAIDARLTRLEKSLGSRIASIETHQANLKKSLTSPTDEVLTLLKSIDADMQAIGMRPRAHAAHVPGTVVAQPGQQASLSKKEISQKLEKAVRMGKIQPLVAINYDVSGEIDQELLKSLL